MDNLKSAIDCVTRSENLLCTPQRSDTEEADMFALAQIAQTYATIALVEAVKELNNTVSMSLI